MDKLTQYRALIKEWMTDRAKVMRSQPLPGEEILCLLDDATDNYILMRVGWVDRERLYSITLHLRIVDGKIWVEENQTDDFVNDLMEEGVRPEDFVAALVPPGLRRQPKFIAA